MDWLKGLFITRVLVPVVFLVLGSVVLSGLLYLLVLLEEMSRELYAIYMTMEWLNPTADKFTDLFNIGLVAMIPIILAGIGMLVYGIRMWRRGRR